MFERNQLVQSSYFHTRNFFFPTTKRTTHVDAGKNPASATPRKKRATRRPWYEVTIPMSVMTTPQLKSRTDIHIEGRTILRMMLLGTSNLKRVVFAHWSAKSNLEEGHFTGKIRAVDT